MAAKKKVVIEEVVEEVPVEEVVGETVTDNQEPVSISTIEEPNNLEIETTILDIKRKAYERTIELNKVDFSRMVESAQTSFPFQSDDNIIAQLEFLKDKIGTYPDLIDAFITELKGRGLIDLADDFQGYYDSIDYTKPWMRM